MWRTSAPNPKAGADWKRKICKAQIFTRLFGQTATVPKSGAASSPISHLRLASLEARAGFCFSKSKGSESKPRFLLSCSELHLKRARQTLFAPRRPTASAPLIATGPGKGQGRSASGLDHKSRVFPAPRRSRGRPREAEAFTTRDGSPKPRKRGRRFFSAPRPLAPLRLLSPAFAPAGRGGNNLGNAGRSRFSPRALAGPC